VIPFHYGPAGMKNFSGLGGSVKLWR